MAFDYGSLVLATGPELVVVIASLAVLFLDLAVLRNESLQNRFHAAAALSCVGCVAGFVWILVAGGHTPAVPGVFASDPVSQVAKQAVLALTLFTALLSGESRITEHAGEFFSLLLLSAVGMMLLVSSENLLMIFISLELTSLSLYVLAGFDRSSPQSAEASLKYFLFGGMAAAVALFGLSYVYGLSGSIELRGIAAAIEGQGMNGLMAAALVMTVAGFGFKVAAAPFHVWAPGTYQGANACAAGFIASASKVAGLVVLSKFLIMGLGGAAGSGAWGGIESGWALLIVVLALLSLVIGNLAAIAQTDVKRLLAFSAVAHAGYALVGVLANDARGLGAIVYYGATYGLATLGAFGVVVALERHSESSKTEAFAGLSRRSPVLAFCMMIFLLSLAGIPPLAGFFGKFYVFAAAASGAQGSGILWVVAAAVALSAVSLYYYLQVLKQMYVRDARAGAEPLPLAPLTTVAVVVMAVLVIWLGCVPGVIVDRVSGGALREVPAGVTH